VIGVGQRFCTCRLPKILGREAGGDPMLPLKSVKQRSTHEDNSVRPIKQDRGGNVVIYAAVGSAFSNSPVTPPALYQAFPPAKARHLMSFLEFHYVFCTAGSLLGFLGPKEIAFLCSVPRRKTNCAQTLAIAG
jgi:hypothetical protein